MKIVVTVHQQQRVAEVHSLTRYVVIVTTDLKLAYLHFISTVWVKLYYHQCVNITTEDMQHIHLNETL